MSSKRCGARPGAGSYKKSVVVLLSIFGIAASKFAVPVAWADGGWYSRDLLEGGDAAVWAAPEADFADEMCRMNLAPSRFEAQLTGESHSVQTIDAESADLQAALKQRKIPAPRLDDILQAHQAARTKLADFVRALEQYRQSKRNHSGEDPDSTPEAEPKPPQFPSFAPVPELPQEFADYFMGAVAWNNPALTDKKLPRESWERLLELPPAERRYKSVWAAFMLGKSWEESDPEKAADYFAQVRDLTKHHFADPLGLAAASLGLEARIRLKQKEHEQALELYLAQLGAGDDTAMESLRITSREALFAEPAALLSLAKNPRTQRTLTAYLISLGPPGPASGEDTPDSEPRATARKWLQAVERAEVRDPETAEKLALLAYQHDELKLAHRWLERAPGSPVAGWIRAKLLLRDGKIELAESLLNRLTASFPLVPHNPTNRVAPESLKDTLSVGRFSTAERHLLGELGAVRLHRGEFVPALDALLNSGFWRDAAYVAEKVLTVEELKAYVDGSWPAVSPPQELAEEEKYGVDEASPPFLRKKIRYLLARRLTREIHGDEAREYYPEEWLTSFDALSRALRTGWDESAAAELRAQSLFDAAFIARTNGMELLGTEVEPDWHICNGASEGEPVASFRSTNSAGHLLCATKDELTRAEQHHADPEARFHYRYQAAFLAWEAAKLMPSHSDETAYVLWTGGSWLKNTDPNTADLFYKALVRRNRNTALGSRADRSRWFPQLDDSGHLLPEQEFPMTEMAPMDAPPDEPNPDPAQLALLDLDGSDSTMIIPDAPPVITDGPGPAELESALQTEAFYVVHKGDSLQSIVTRLNAAGLQLGWEQLVQANPDLDPAKLKIGQKIYLPGDLTQPPP